MFLSRGSELRFWVLLLLLLAGVKVGAEAQESLDGMTFRDALSKCLLVAGEGDMENAAVLFGRLEQIFGNEAEYLAEEVQRQALPVKGLAELAAGNPGQAIDTLERARRQFPSLFVEKPSLIYSLAQAYKGNGKLEEARRALGDYLRQGPGALEAGFAYLERADLYFQEGFLDEGLEGLGQLYRSTLPRSVKMQGQLKAVEACLKNDRKDRATALILETDWSVSAMPELAQLAFAALRTAEHALADRRVEVALKLFQLVPPKKILIEAQRERIEALRQGLAFDRARRSGRERAHRQQYLTQMQQRLEQQLQALEEAADYTPDFYLRYGQCLLLDAQLHKAWLVFEHTALNDAYPEAVREEAHYRWALTAHQMEEWEEALTLTRNFVDRYPNSELAPQALYLIASSHLEQRRYRESREVLSDLVDGFPDSALFPRWLFTRGFVQVLLEDYGSARQDFATYLSRFPQGSLRVNAGLWDGLTYFFEKNYATCADLLTTLSSAAQNHPLYPEIRYRLASTHYAGRRYDEALPIINRYLEEFPRHGRVGEAQVLKGDILMGKGELEDALDTFAGVSSEVGRLYLYSVFQAGKILRALRDYTGMIAHFEAFLQNETAPPGRLSEALYWLAWAHQQEGAPEQAFAMYERALVTYGDVPQSAEIESILKALRNLKANRGSDAIPGSSDSRNPLASAEDFSSWILREIEIANQGNRLTYYARLVLYFIEQVEEPDTNEFSYSALAQRVPPEKMDAATLGRMGLALLEVGDEPIRSYFEQLLDRFPNSPDCAMAYLGLAKLEFAAGDYPAARTWLDTSNEQIPLHPRLSETQLLLGRTLAHMELFEESIAVYEKLLRLKMARGRPHARALRGIAECHTRSGAMDKAIAYYQRIYNLYRAYPDLVSSAYWKSANLFEAVGRLPEAAATLREMLSQEKLKGLPEWEWAETRLENLVSLLPKEPSATPEEEGGNHEN